MNITKPHVKYVLDRFHSFDMINQSTVEGTIVYMDRLKSKNMVIHIQKFLDTIESKKERRLCAGVLKLYYQSNPEVADTIIFEDEIEFESEEGEDYFLSLIYEEISK